MKVTITGEHRFPGTMLIKAAQWSQKHAWGQRPETKRQAGADIVTRYLEANTVRIDAWARGINLQPEVAIARACVHVGALKKAGAALEAASSVEERRELLGEIVGMTTRAQASTFGHSWEPDDLKCEEEFSLAIPAGAIERELAPDLFGLAAWGISLSKQGITQAQIDRHTYEIYAGQTGVKFHESIGTRVGYPEKDEEAVGDVSLQDVQAFADWLGLALPSEARLSSAKDLFDPKKPWEWLAPAKSREEVVYSLAEKITRSRAHILGRDIGFRVATKADEPVPSYMLFGARWEK